MKIIINKNCSEKIKVLEYDGWWYFGMSKVSIVDWIAFPFDPERNPVDVLFYYWLAQPSPHLVDLTQQGLISA